jgi:hypothetical protein
MQARRLTSADGILGTHKVEDLTGQVFLDLAIGQRNGAEWSLRAYPDSGVSILWGIHLTDVRSVGVWREALLAGRQDLHQRLLIGRAACVSGVPVVAALDFPVTSWRTASCRFGEHL